MRSLLILLFAAFSHGRAGEDHSGKFTGNLTVAFFPDNQGDSCEAKDISKAITFTTETRPNAYTCFNMSDIFTRNSSSGFQRAQGDEYVNRTYGFYGPNGIDWSLYNQDLYDEKANYTHTWIKMASRIDPHEGKKSKWYYEQYTLPGCQDVRLGDEESDDVPFYWISCQTSVDGFCKTAAYPIGSFAVWKSPGQMDDDESDCLKWVEYGGDAAAAKVNAGWLVAALVTAVLMML